MRDMIFVRHSASALTVILSDSPQACELAKVNQRAPNELTINFWTRGSAPVVTGEKPLFNEALLRAGQASAPEQFSVGILRQPGDSWNTGGGVAWLDAYDGASASGRFEAKMVPGSTTATAFTLTGSFVATPCVVP